MTTQCCNNCQREIPSSNFELHLLRCPGKRQQDIPSSSSSKAHLHPLVNEIITRGIIFGQIPCSFQDLDALQAHFPFIPNSQQCRPNAEV